MKKLDSSFLGLFLDSVLGILSCIMAFTSAIMITLGFITWCSQMTQRFPSWVITAHKFLEYFVTFALFFRCEIAAGQNITTEQDRIDTLDFYFQMGTAQFGAWSSFAASVGLTVFALLKLVSDHQMRNMKASMYLERQRLVNEDSFRDDGISDMPQAHHFSRDSPFDDEDIPK